MDPLLLIVIIFIAAILNVWIFWAIIRDATETKKSIKLLEAQTQLLVSIALKLGVDKESVLKDTKEVMR